MIPGSWNNSTSLVVYFSDSESCMELLRRLQVYLTAAVVIAVLYSGWIFLGRRGTIPRIGAPDRQQTSREAEWERIYGGTAVKILQFYAREESVIEGDKSVLC